MCQTDNGFRMALKQAAIGAHFDATTAKKQLPFSQALKHVISSLGKQPCRAVSRVPCVQALYTRRMMQGISSVPGAPKPRASEPESAMRRHNTQQRAWAASRPQRRDDTQSSASRASSRLGNWSLGAAEVAVLLRRSSGEIAAMQSINSYAAKQSWPARTGLKH